MTECHMLCCYMVHVGKLGDNLFAFSCPYVDIKYTDKLYFYMLLTIYIHVVKRVNRELYHKPAYQKYLPTYILYIFSSFAFRNLNTETD